MRRFWPLLLPVCVLTILAAWRYFFPAPPHVQLTPEPAVAAGSVLIIAPHPDDEVLAAGGLIQATLAAGGRVHVVLVTNGDGFRLAAERWRGRAGLTPAGMVALGRQRQQESLAALRSLGLRAAEVTFLGFPDEGIAHLWQENWQVPYRSPFTGAQASPYAPGLTPYTGRALLATLEAILATERPTTIIYPHPQDAHPDHWAVHHFTTAALEALRGRGLAPAERLYLVHRGDWPAPKGLRPEAALLPPAPLIDRGTAWAGMPLPPAAVQRKADAIRLYQTQIALMRRYLLSFARSSELFGSLPPLSLPASAGTWQALETDPPGDTLLRELLPAADAIGVDVARTPAALQVRLRVRGIPAHREQYRLTLHTFRSGSGWSEPATQVQQPGPAGMRAAEASVRFTLPFGLAGAPDAVILDLTITVDGVQADRTGGRLLLLPRIPEVGR